MAKVIAPNKQYNGLSATVMFVNGVGETDNPNLLEWFESKGYEIERTDDEQKDIPVEKMTLPQLKEYARANKIDLGEATRKDDVLAAIHLYEQQSDGKQQGEGNDQQEDDGEQPADEE